MLIMLCEQMNAHGCAESADAYTCMLQLPACARRQPCSFIFTTDMVRPAAAAKACTWCDLPDANAQLPYQTINTYSQELLLVGDRRVLFPQEDDEWQAGVTACTLHR
jgi:hypothetical protein